MNEPIARKRYKVISQKCHSNFSVSETGIVLSVDWPYIGASPDAVVQCSCCGPGAAEFKVTWTQGKNNQGVCSGPRYLSTHQEWECGIETHTQVLLSGTNSDGCFESVLC